MGSWHKYRAQRVEIDGHTFPSKLEAKRYTTLRTLLRANKIRDLELQPKYPIIINDIKCCNVVFDFRYFDNEKNQIVVEDTKGFDMPISKLKRKLAMAQYGIEIQLVSER